MTSTKTHAENLADFRAIMAGDTGMPTADQCAAAIVERAANLPAGPDMWAMWHLPHESDTATVCEFDGCCCYECYTDPAEALAQASRLNASGYSEGGSYIVALLPRGVAADNMEVGAVRVTGPATPYVAGMSGGYVTLDACVSDLVTYGRA